MALSYPNVHKIVKSYLDSQSGLTALTSTRIYVGKIPASQTTCQQMIVLKKIGGTDSGNLMRISKNAAGKIVANPTIEFRCFGTNLNSAYEVHGKLIEVFSSIENQYITNVGSILLTKPESSGSNLIDPETGWDFIYSTFDVVVSS